MNTVVKNVLVMLTGLALATGCAPKVRDLQPSGFLSTYADLRPTQAKDFAQYQYINNDVDFSAYKKIIVDPLVFYMEEDKVKKAIQSNELEKLADDYNGALTNALSDGYPIITRPGPGVMRLRFAITDLVRTDSGFTYIITAEAEILDSQTNERLAAAVDTQESLKVKEMLNKWARRFRLALDRLSGKK